MRLGIFVLAAGKGVGGPETYEVELARALVRVDPTSAYHVYCTSREAAAAMTEGTAALHGHVLWPKSRWISVPISLPLALLRDRIDLFHATYTPPPMAPRPYVFTHHDNSPFDHPEYYDPVVLTRLRPLIRTGLAKARHIICPSEFTRRRTAEKFGIRPESMTVIPHGVNARYRPLDSAEVGFRLRERYGIQTPYFLWIGKMQGSKNTPRLLEAYARLRARLPDAPMLVLAGKRAVADIDVDALLTRFELHGKIRELGYVPQEDLPWLYCGARALTFTSIYEGFGLPVMEAMASGTPVLTSKVCALPEVAGDAALLVDPYSVEAIEAAMFRLATEDGLVADLSSRGRERARGFSWDEHARRTLEVYRHVLATGGRRRT